MKNRYPLLIVLLTAFFLYTPVLKSQDESNKGIQRTEHAFLERLPHADLGNGYYKNPVMVGPGSDNTIIRVDSDFYMVAGGGWPDQLIWHSRDLVNWQPLTRALHNFDGGAWASDIVYHKGKYYIYTTEVNSNRGNAGSLSTSERSLLGVPFKDQGDKAFKNVVFWADNPSGPWSDPIDIGVYGLIDPGHIVDHEGNRYLYFNKGMIIKLTPDGLGTVDDLKIVYDGWTYPAEWVVECKCLEAPKLIYHNGYYYLSSAQGGTSGPSTAHMGIMARSKSVDGPWENSPYNPIVHTSSRQEKWWRQGHGTLIDDIEGKWWYLYTGYENAYTHYGKQSLLLPVEWTENDWPRIVPGVNVSDILKKPAGDNVGHGMPLSDNFTSTEIGIQWMYGRNVNPDEVFKVGNGKLTIQGRGTSHRDAASISIMPVNHSYEVEAEISISDNAEGGILLSGGSRAGSFACAGLRKGELFARWSRLGNSLPWNGDKIHIRIRNNKFDISCYYSKDGKHWILFKRSTELDGVRRVSLYAAGTGEVVIRNFTYRGLD